MRTHVRAGRFMLAGAMVMIACMVVVGISSAAESSPAPASRPGTSAPAAASPESVQPAAEPATRTEPQATDRKPAAKPAPEPAAKPAPAGEKATPVDGTPCTSTARACVDLDDRQAWLIDNGKVTRGPVGIMTGDDEDPTPLGTFSVQWKAKEYTSREYLTQMPYSVFFADGGVAFHEGNQRTNSAGCVKLTHDDAVAWFDTLQVGDQVQIH